MGQATRRQATDAGQRMHHRPQEGPGYGPLSFAVRVVFPYNHAERSVPRVACPVG